jgi:hypothetical protein
MPSAHKRSEKHRLSSHISSSLLDRRQGESHKADIPFTHSTGAGHSNGPGPLEVGPLTTVLTKHSESGRATPIIAHSNAPLAPSILKVA